MDRPLPNTYWVEPGRLLAGEHPLGRLGTEPRTESLRSLLAAGVRQFIDLTEPGECNDYGALLPAGCTYLRRAIPDCDVPPRPEVMHELQALIRAALQEGTLSYVHCRAGIGRTGTTIGCYLVERGASGEEALEELNALWQQSERSRSWPLVPQTAEQAEYIRRWRAPSDGSTPRPEPSLSSLRGVRARFLGSLLGTALGDALAAPAQFRRAGAVPAIGELQGGGPFDLPRGAWSDDTAMMLCLADSLCACQGFNAPDQVQRYQRWQREGYLSASGQCVGITAEVAKALAHSGWRRQQYAGSHDPARLDPEPLSRVVAAVAYYFADVDAAVRYAAEQARTTCQAPRVLDACRLLGAMVHTALRGAGKAEVLNPPAVLFAPLPLKPDVAALLEAGQVLAPPAPLRGSTHTALQALGAARWAFATTSSFREGALRAVSLGGSADVIGAIYGQLAGAHYGSAALPPLWVGELAQREAITALADQLLAAALVGLSQPAPEAL